MQVFKMYVQGFYYANFVFSFIFKHIWRTILCKNVWKQTIISHFLGEQKCTITKTRLFKYIEHFTPKNWQFSDTKTLIFFIFLLNSLWVLVRTASASGSNEYPQSMFLNRNKKINIYPCKPQFYYIKVGIKGVKII